jgi:peptide/nickel transport system permease protein
MSAWRYALRRLGFYLIAAWAALTLNFFIPRMMPGDPATSMFARFKGKLQPEALDALREAFGLVEGPLWEQYLMYLKHVAQGEFGISVAYFPAPVESVILTGMGWTLLLAGVAVVISFTLGTILGALAAWKRRTWIDGILPPAFVLLGAFPYFWLAMVALYVFGFVLGVAPLRHAYDDMLDPGFTWAFISSVVQHAMLPALTIVAATVGGWLLSMRNTMIGVLGEDYVTLAQAKGLSRRRVFFRYAVRNALLPNVTGFGMALGFVISGSLLTEIVFSYPGQGYLLIQAVRTQDYPLMQGLFLMITLAVLAANWFVDLAYMWLDPRTGREVGT